MPVYDVPICYSQAAYMVQAEASSQNVATQIVTYYAEGIARGYTTHLGDDKTFVRIVRVAKQPGNPRCDNQPGTGTWETYRAVID